MTVVTVEFHASYGNAQYRRAEVSRVRQEIRENGESQIPHVVARKGGESLLRRVRGRLFDKGLIRYLRLSRLFLTVGEDRLFFSGVFLKAI